jgi:hypothetical protein
MAPAANGGKARKNDGIVDQDMPPDQQLSLLIVADSAENEIEAQMGSPLLIRATKSSDLRCSAART